jgi:hypothetical protein
MYHRHDLDRSTMAPMGVANGAAHALYKIILNLKFYGIARE